jgi:hypothetical protein
VRATGTKCPILAYSKQVSATRADPA